MSVVLMALAAICFGFAALGWVRSHKFDLTAGGLFLLSVSLLLKGVGL